MFLILKKANTKPSKKGFIMCVKMGIVYVAKSNIYLKGAKMDKQFSIDDAKSKLRALIYSVEDGQSVKLTRHGKPVAVLSSIHDYELLSKNRMDFWKALSDFRSRLALEDISITDADFEGIRDASTGREREIYE